MSLEFVGIDPDTEKDGSPTVWVEEETADLILQGEKADALLAAEIRGQSWSPGHSAGIPAHESVTRIPARMVPIIRKACDAAERRAASGTEL
ncbi:hypothetical protein ACEZCY_27010 [Streptacidiphilus sp. N1-12]|uniref:Uncharacterized protein n=2 Tax=Streptacidiphilus alkalitolerans TaxID=3342712 RepID=A0ABV6VG90_9ACTN